MQVLAKLALLLSLVCTIYLSQTNLYNLRSWVAGKVDANDFEDMLKAIITVIPVYGRLQRIFTAPMMGSLEILIAISVYDILVAPTYDHYNNILLTAIFI